jgi:hypothetical protein
VRFTVERDEGGSFRGWLPVVATERFDALYGDWEHQNYDWGALVRTKSEAQVELRGARAACAVAAGLSALQGAP